MSTDLRSCRVRVTQPRGAQLDVTLTAVVPYDALGQRPAGPPLDLGDPGAVPVGLRDRAQQRLAALLAPQYEVLAVPAPRRGLRCVFDADHPILSADVDLTAEATIEFDGALYAVTASSPAVRRYYDGVLDETRVLG